MKTQGWYESDGNTMCFYQHGFSMPHVVNHLSNYVNFLHEGKKTVMLNAHDVPFACEAKDVAADDTTNNTEKEKRRNALEKVDKDDTQVQNNNKSDKVENENEWIRTPSARQTQKSNNKKRDELKKKGCDHNRFSRLQEMIGDDNDTQEVISEADEQDENRKEKNKMIKNIEKQKEPHHVDNVKMGDLEKIINAFLVEDIV